MSIEFGLQSVFVARRRHRNDILLCRVKDISRTGRILCRTWNPKTHQWRNMVSIHSDDVLAIIGQKMQTGQELDTIARECKLHSELIQTAADLEKSCADLQLRLANRMTAFLTVYR